jgi:hypothetical protein
MQGLIWCLFFNFIGGTALLITDGGEIAAWLWASIWMVGGIPGAYILWYARLYNASIKDSAFGYALFFAGFFANLAFSIWSAVGAWAPPLLFMPSPGPAVTGMLPAASATCWAQGLNRMLLAWFGCRTACRPAVPGREEPHRLHLCHQPHERQHGGGRRLLHWRRLLDH